jgi:hypothetical protein
MTKTMTNTCIYDIETKPSLQALQVKDALNYSDSSITYRPPARSRASLF